jgi:predicted dithiol-disulfide oxidoreductase (DUF899 family)
MGSIEQAAGSRAARREQVQALQRRLHWGAHWMSSVRCELQHDVSSVKPEDAARGETFYNSTCCWV